MYLGQDGRLSNFAPLSLQFVQNLSVGGSATKNLVTFSRIRHDKGQRDAVVDAGRCTNATKKERKKRLLYSLRQQR